MSLPLGRGHFGNEAMNSMTASFVPSQSQSLSTRTRQDLDVDLFAVLYALYADHCMVYSTCVSRKVEVLWASSSGSSAGSTNFRFFSFTIKSFLKANGKTIFSSGSRIPSAFRIQRVPSPGKTSPPADKQN